MMLALLVGLLVWAAPVQAVEIFSQNFDAMTTQSACATIVSEGGFTDCREDPEHPNAPGDVSVVESTSGCSSSMPSGTKAMRVHVDGQTGQGDAGVKVGAGTNIDYLPASTWMQWAMCINNSGAEVPSNLQNRPMKLFYPCKGDYPCGTDTRAGNYMLQTSTQSSYAPFYDTSLDDTQTGDMWLILRDSTEGFPNWTGAAGGGAEGSDSTKLGQTNLSERLRPNRWNIVRCHQDFTNISAASMECWIGEMGSPLTKVMEWIGGTTVEGSAFIWEVDDATGHAHAWLPSTQGAGSTEYPQETFLYFDDIVFATSEDDLPTYGAGGGTPAPRFSPGHNLRRAEHDLAMEVVAE